jgi:hypothetical protein
LSGAGEAKRRDISTWFSASTLTEKCVAPRKASRVGLALRSDHRMSGGSSDSALKELAVRPTGLPSTARQPMMVTPVANRPSAARSARVETAESTTC